MNAPLLSDAVFQSTLDSLPAADRYLVAYSGGMDSSVLLLLTTLYGRLRNKSVIAVHIDHGLQPESASWSGHCRDRCEQLVIPIEILPVDASPGQGQSPEAAAREARYRALEECVQQGDMLLTAHHQDDQAETLLLQLVRGAGPEGLAAMPAVKAFGHGLHARPLLAYNLESIKTFANDNELQWIDDTSNRDVRFDRNFLRTEIMPLLKKRWPSIPVTLSRAASHQADAGENQRALASIDRAATPEMPKDRLAVSVLERLSPARSRNLLRYWLHDNKVPLPSCRLLDTLLSDLVHARADATPCVQWAGVEVRRFQECLYVMSEIPAHDNTATYAWHLEEPLQLPVGTLTARKVNGDGIAEECLDDGTLEVRFRRGGELLQPTGQMHHRELKKLFQEAGVPPWVRDRIPLLFNQQRLVAVAGYWIDAACHTGDNKEGWSVGFDPVPSTINY